MAEFKRYAFATVAAALAFAATGGFQAMAQATGNGASATQAGEAAIPFVNHGGVRDWQAAGDDKVYVQDSQGKWYLATLAMPSPDLPFATAIGFETKGIDRLDKYGAVVIAGSRYPLASLVASGPPPAKPKK